MRLTYGCFAQSLGYFPYLFSLPFTLSCSAWKQPSAQLSSLFAFAARISCGFISSSALCVRGLHVLIPLWSFRKVEVRIGFRFGLGRELDNTLCLKVKNQGYQYVCVWGAGGWRGEYVIFFFFLIFVFLFFCSCFTKTRNSSQFHWCSLNLLLREIRTRDGSDEHIRFINWVPVWEATCLRII